MKKLFWLLLVLVAVLPFWLEVKVLYATNGENLREVRGDLEGWKWPGEMGNIVEQQGEEPSDYYRFGSIMVDIQSDKSSYLPGETSQFKGTITNTNSYPIINGQLYVRVLQENEIDSQQNGDYIIDEFFALEEIYLKTGEKKKFDFTWKVPISAPSDNYKLATFFTVDKKYNLSGLSFASNIYASFCSFNVKGTKQSRIFFDKNKAKFNDKPYHFRAFIPEVTSKDKVKISVPLTNTYDISKEVRINYDLYFWDGLLESNKIKSDSESITIPANSSQNIEYFLDELNKSVYFLRISAQSQTEKSIINIRFGVKDVPGARVNFAGITNFPVEKGEKAKVFVTFHSITPADFEGSLSFSLKDKQGKEIASKIYQGVISQQLMVDTAEVIIGENLSHLTLEADLHNSDNQLIDKALVTYQEEEQKRISPKISPQTRKEKEPSFFSKLKEKTNLILSIFVIPLMVIGAYFYLAKTGRVKLVGWKVMLTVMLLIFLLIVFFIACFVPSAEASSATGTNQVLDYLLQFPGSGGADIDSTAKAFYFTLNVNYDLFLKQGEKILEDGDEIDCSNIDFDFNKNGEWFIKGGAWDTPSAYWEEGFDFSEKKCQSVDYFTQSIYSPTWGWRDYSAYGPLIVVNPGYRIEAISGPVTCQENTCSVVEGGEIVVKAIIDKTEFTQWIYHTRFGQCARENASCGCYSSIFFKNAYEDCSGCANCCQRNTRYQSLPVAEATRIWRLRAVCPTSTPIPTPTPTITPTPLPSCNCDSIEYSGTLAKGEKVIFTTYAKVDNPATNPSKVLNMVYHVEANGTEIAHSVEITPTPPVQVTPTPSGQMYERYSTSWEWTIPSQGSGEVEYRVWVEINCGYKTAQTTNLSNRVLAAITKKNPSFFDLLFSFFGGLFGVTTVSPTPTPTPTSPPSQPTITPDVNLLIPTGRTLQLGTFIPPVRVEKGCTWMKFWIVY